MAIKINIMKYEYVIKLNLPWYRRIGWYSLFFVVVTALVYIVSEFLIINLPYVYDIVLFIVYGLFWVLSFYFWIKLHLIPSIKESKKE